MNIELLRKVQEHIKAEPKRWTFGWATASHESPCGTQACIGGWTVLLSKGTTDWRESGLSREAMKLLDIDRDQAARLFFCWPEEFMPISAKEATARIDRFIETDGAE